MTYQRTGKIPDGLVYRIYGDELAVVMNPGTRKVCLLRGNPLSLWRELVAVGRPQMRQAGDFLLGRLANLGVFDMLESSRSRAGKCSRVDPEKVDIGVFNYFAFKNRIPISGHIELTGRCNLRCRHCYCVCRGKRSDSLSTSQVCDIIDDLHQNGTLGLVLTGGEIFLRRDIMDILRHLARRGFILRLNTNATLIDEKIIRELTGFTNIYRIHVSVYSSEPEVHDYITGVHGSFKKTMRALHMMKEAGLALRINCSLMKSNFGSYLGVQEIGDKLGVPVRIDPMIFPRDDGSTDNLAEQIDDEMRTVFFARRQRKGTDSAQKRRKVCKAACSFLSICEDGSVYPCFKTKRLYDRSLGNLTKTTLATIWHDSPQIKKLRAGLDKQMRQCDICELTI